MDFKKFEYIFFDLDGTLTDSAEGILNCLKYSLAKFGFVEHDEAKLRCFIGPSLKETYHTVYGLDEAQIKQATAFYRERFDAEGHKENKIYEGAREMLAALQASGRKVVLATAKPMVQAKVILEHFGLAKYFTGIFGSNLDGTREQKYEVIEYALQELKITDKSKVVMIGDRKHDILGAKQNGLASIAVLYGYGSEVELVEAGCDAKAESVAELQKMLLG